MVSLEQVSLRLWEATIRSPYLLRLQAPDVRQSFSISFRVFDQYVHDQLVLPMLSSQVSSLIKVSTLTAHRNGRVQVKLQIARRLDKFFQLFDVF